MNLLSYSEPNMAADPTHQQYSLCGQARKHKPQPAKFRLKSCNDERSNAHCGTEHAKKELLCRKLKNVGEIAKADFGIHQHF